MEKFQVTWHLKFDKDDYQVGKRVWAQCDPDNGLYDTGNVTEIKHDGVIVMFPGWNKSRFFKYEDSPSLIRYLDEQEEPAIQIVDLDED